MSKKWECLICDEENPKGPCVYINPGSDQPPNTCPMTGDEAKFEAAQKEGKEAEPSTSKQHTKVTICPDCSPGESCIIIKGLDCKPNPCELYPAKREKRVEEIASV